MVFDTVDQKDECVIFLSQRGEISAAAWWVGMCTSFATTLSIVIAGMLVASPVAHSFLSKVFDVSTGLWN